MKGQVFFYEGQQRGIFNEKTIFNYKNSIMFRYVKKWVICNLSNVQGSFMKDSKGDI